MKALHRHEVREFKSSEKKTHWETQARSRPLTLSSEDAATISPGSVSAIRSRSVAYRFQV
jgi:hypothetical protein